MLKGEEAELEFYFRKIPLHQQKFLVVSVLSNSPYTPASIKFFGGFNSFQFALVAEKFRKMSKMKLLSSFQLATQRNNGRILKANLS